MQSSLNLAETTNFEGSHLQFWRIASRSLSLSFSVFVSDILNFLDKFVPFASFLPTCVTRMQLSLQFGLQVNMVWSWSSNQWFAIPSNTFMQNFVTSIKHVADPKTCYSHSSQIDIHGHGTTQTELAILLKQPIQAPLIIISVVKPNWLHSSLTTSLHPNPIADCKVAITSISSFYSSILVNIGCKTNSIEDFWGYDKGVLLC